MVSPATSNPSSTSMFNIIVTEFEEKFEKGEFSGWPRETGATLTHTGANLDLSSFLCSEKLASLSLASLKSFLMGLGLKCEAFLHQRKLFK